MTMRDLTKLPQPSPACIPPQVTDQRGLDAFTIRFGTATNEAIPTPSIQQVPNTDEANLADKSGSYTKGLAQVQYGQVDLNVFAKFRAALGTSDGKTPGTGNFEAVTLGGNTKLNGPLGSFAGTLVGADSQNFTVPPAYTVGSLQYATELVELYWASLLRDVPFSQYPTNQTAIDAANELNGMKATYDGPLDAAGNVTPHVLFRGGYGNKPGYFAKELVGPYISQLCIVPTNLGAQPLQQKVQTFVAGLDFMTDLTAWFNVQKGIAPPASEFPDPTLRHMHNGRALAAYTHQDELYQAYLVAYLALNNTLKTPPNPTNPYASLTRQKPFGTFGGPDIAATLGAVARAAINAVWYQKWVIHLRHRPEAGGGIVHLMQNPSLPQTMAKIDNLALNSKAVANSFSKYGSYLLSQAFSEGSPTHPAYPTGHGTVAGACITVLKFFFDGNSPIPSPMVPTLDGQSLVPYTGADASQMTVNGELHKLAHNISFGHGIHGGIHWRSDTDTSILLGEAVAIKFLQDQAWTYKEGVDVTFTKIDGTAVTIKNF